MNNKRHLRTPLLFLCLFIATLGSCTHPKDSKPRTSIKNGVVVSVKDQKIAVVRNGRKVKSYSVSTSKFGLGDTTGSYRTPIGEHKIAEKIGANQPQGMVFKSRKPTGEVIPPGSPGRDPIVSRILWLDGKEPINANAKRRNIYIHGTADESSIGRPSSYGCIRMTTKDVVDIFGQVGKGETVAIETCSLDTYFTPPKPIAHSVPKLVEPTPTLVTTDAGSAPPHVLGADASLTVAASTLLAKTEQAEKGPIFISTPKLEKGAEILPPLPADPPVLPDVHPELVDPSELPAPILADDSLKLAPKKGGERAVKGSTSKKKDAKSKKRTERVPTVSSKSSKSKLSSLSKSTKKKQVGSKKKATKKKR